MTQTLSSGPTDTELKMCRNKVRYTEPYKAYLSIAHQKIRGNEKSESMRVYRCPFCRGHHITTQEKKKSETSPEYLAKLLQRQGFDGDFSKRFSQAMIG